MTLYLIILNALEDTFFNWTWTNFPSIVPVGALMWFTWWIRGLLIEYRNRFAKVESDSGQLNSNQIATTSRLDTMSSNQIAMTNRLDTMTSRLDNMDKRFDNMDRRFDKMDRRFDKIETNFTTLITLLASTKKIDIENFNSQSPIELTDAGVKILVEMGGKTYIDTALESLMNSMEGQTFKSGLDVENYCMILLNGKINDDEFTPIKNYIFNHPMQKTSDGNITLLDLPFAITIMSIYLRNRYFEKHPELITGIS